MNPNVVQAQADSLLVWGEQWAREEDEAGSAEIASLLTRAARLMRGEETARPIGHPRFEAIEAGLPEPDLHSDFREE